MSVPSISPTLRTSVLSFWHEKPLRPELLATEYLKAYPHVTASKRQIADIVRRSKQFVVLSDVKSKRGYDRFGEFEQKRGALVFIDSAHLRRRYLGGSQFVVLATDAYSKATYLEVVKRLTGASVARAFEKIVLRFHQGPIKALISDLGSEYISHEFQTVCRSYGIEHRTTTPSFANKAWAAERRIRELRRILGRFRARGGGRPSLSELLKEAEHYLNHVAKNSITGLTARETTNEKAPFVLLKLQQHRAKIAEEQPKERLLRIGNRVLLRLPAGIFDKTDDPKFSTRVYAVVGVKHTSPRLSYRLRDEITGDTLIGSYPASKLALVEEEETRPEARELAVSSYSPPLTRSKAVLFSRISNGSQVTPI